MCFADSLHPEFRTAQQFFNLFGSDRAAFDFGGYDPFGGFPADIGYFALQISNAGFAGVFADDFQQRFIRELDLFRTQPVGFHLLPDQKSLGDFELFVFGIAGELDHFHAVLQSPRNGVQHIRGRDEHHHREVELGIQVMIHKHVVLFRIEHFEQRRRRIAAEIHAHFVHFIQHENRIARSRLSSCTG